LFEIFRQLRGKQLAAKGDWRADPKIATGIARVSEIRVSASSISARIIFALS
jgi:hypothetical protein